MDKQVHMAQRLEKFIEGVNKKKKEYREKMGFTYADRFFAELDKPGRKYQRVLSFEEYSNGVISNQGVFCFIDLVNGDVLKANGYRAPEKKNPRSNIFDDDFGMSGVNHHGAIYLK